MYNYRLTLQYDGSRYKGWQRLGQGEATIQDKLEQVITQLVAKPTEIIGCSRTDAGVHALAQIANFKSETPLNCPDVLRYLNHYLPKDICVTEVEEVSEQFHARYHAKDKTYLYKIWNKEYSNPFLRKYSMHVNRKLNLEDMRQAGGFLLGTHDFTAFSNAKSKKKSMERTIYAIEVQEQEGLIEIRIRGDGFLYNMVRWMVGTLVAVGLGEIKKEELPGILEAKERNRTGDLADAGGLYLERITY
ncbi:MAG: tRNA pseudouridine(38-40) synthase TruA [Firmicutes bacterium]|nr:tRNA pseudouridine(38-40) synthase TruA [Bacillota bacterium]